MRRLILCSAIIAAACSSTDDTALSPKSDIVMVSLLACSENSGSRVDYTYDGDETMEFSWSEGDKIGIALAAADDSTPLSYGEFVASSAGAQVEFVGEIEPWTEGNKKIYGIYPYTTENYVEGSSMEKINLDQSVQSYDVTNHYFQNGVMTAEANIRWSSGGTINYVAPLTFNQLMSFFRVNVTNIPANERVTSMGFRTSGNYLILQCLVWTSSSKLGTTSTYTKGKVVSMEVLNHTAGANVTLNMAVIPNDLTASSRATTLYIQTTDTSEQVREYTMLFESGLNFVRNNFLMRASDGVLDLQTEMAMATL